MAAKEVSKKKYLKILNKRLRAEPAAPAGASFVFFPLGAKAKHATGVVSGDALAHREAAPASTRGMSCAITGRASAGRCRDRARGSSALARCGSDGR